MPKKLQKKVKVTKRVPADYDDADQSDSDHHHHSDHDNNPTSPKISQAKGCHAYQLRQLAKTNKSTATPQSATWEKTPLSPAPETSDAGKRKIARELNLQSKLATVQAAERDLQAKRARRAQIFEEVGVIEEGLQANRDRITARLQAEEDDEITRPPRPYNRRSYTIIGNHCTKRIAEKLILYNYCPKKWKGLSGSTSNPLKHIREIHYNRLSDEEKGLLSNNGATSGNNAVRRTLNKENL